MHPDVPSVSRLVVVRPLLPCTPRSFHIPSAAPSPPGHSSPQAGHTCVWLVKPVARPSSLPHESCGTDMLCHAPPSLGRCSSTSVRTRPCPCTGTPPGQLPLQSPDPCTFPPNMPNITGGHKGPFLQPSALPGTIPLHLSGSSSPSGLCQKVPSSEPSLKPLSLGVPPAPPSWHGQAVGTEAAFSMCIAPIIPAVGTSPGLSTAPDPHKGSALLGCP